MHSTKMILQMYLMYLFHDAHRHHSKDKWFRRIQASCLVDYLNRLEQRQSEEPQEVDLQVPALDRTCHS